MDHPHEENPEQLAQVLGDFLLARARLTG